MTLGVHRKLAAVGLIVVVGLYVIHALGLGYVVDDAYISFRYAANFASGHGLVYNIGERVEGYTNFLWVVLVAGVLRVWPGCDPLVVSRVISLLCGGATLVILARVSRSLYPRRPWCGLIAPLLLAANTSYCTWSTSGLETTAFALLTMLAVLLTAKEFRDGQGTVGATVVVILVGLLRADGFVVFAILAAVRVLEHRRRHESVFNRWTIGWMAGFVLVIGAQFAWRWSYYGYLFPNTFYDKVGADSAQFVRGLRYLKRYFEAYGGVLIVPLAMVPLLRFEREPVTRFALQCVFGWLAYVCVVGGDGLAFHRFLVPVLPLVYLLVQEGLVEIVRWGEAAGLVRVPGRLRVAVVAMGLATAALGAQTTRRVLRHNDTDIAPYHIYDNYFVDRCTAAGDWLAAHTPDDIVVASTPAGAIAYFSHRTVIDMLGLTDEHIAHREVAKLGTGRAGHEKGDGVYVLSRKPEYILLGNVAVADRPMTEADMKRTLCQRSEHELWSLAQFHEKYELHVVRLASQGPFQYFSFYQRKPSAVAAGSLEFATLFSSFCDLSEWMGTPPATCNGRTRPSAGLDRSVHQ